MMTHCFYLRGYYYLSLVLLLASFPPEAVQVCQEITAFIIRKQNNDNITQAYASLCHWNKTASG